ncbi:MAG: response regulator [Magnetococcales bacterium]|nr:response regulator [Magnetococcales bacterium]
MAQKTVLVVDDSNLVRMMLRRVFAESFPEWTLVEAADGEAALLASANALPDLALIDYNMPGMNGVDLAVKLMANHPLLSIHLVTANVQQRMQERAEALGLGFIKKPITKEKIAAILEG